MTFYSEISGKCIWFAIDNHSIELRNSWLRKNITLTQFKVLTVVYVVLFIDSYLIYFSLFFLFIMFSSVQIHISTINRYHFFNHLICPFSHTYRILYQQKCKDSMSFPHVLRICIFYSSFFFLLLLSNVWLQLFVYLKNLLFVFVRPLWTNKQSIYYYCGCENFIHYFSWWIIAVKSARVRTHARTLQIHID